MNTTPNASFSYRKIGLVFLLTAVLAALKLTDQLYWDWWIVLAPIWLAAIAGVGFLRLGLIFGRSDRRDKCLTALSLFAILAGIVFTSYLFAGLLGLVN